MAKVSVGTLPNTAGAGGSVNGGDLPSEMRKDVPVTQLDSGAKVGEKGEYRPASYQISPGIIRVDR
jgi:hypothetical protein